MSSAPLSPAAAVDHPEKLPDALAVGLAGGLDAAQPQRKSLVKRAEAWLSRLSTKNTFYQRAFSLVWLPFAWRSGISMKRLGENRFVAILPFTRFNRNWYNAMAGAALLGNSEVAGGLYLFARFGGDYIVVCKEMRYRFMRPCFGPAVYEVVKSEDIDAKLATKGEFNIDLDMEVRQELKKRGREMIVGRCSITFHCTPKTLAEARAQSRTERKRSKRTDTDA